MKTEKSAGLLGLAAKHPLSTVGVALAGTAAVRGAMQSGPHAEQIRQQTEAMRHDPSTPVQKFAAAWQEKVAAVSARHDKFGETHTKLAEGGIFGTKPAATTPGVPAMTFGTAMLNTFGGAAVKSITDKLFSAPIDKAFSILDQKFYLEPKQKNVMQQVLQSDPMLARAMQDTPAIVMDAYKTIKQFAPSLVTDANALKTFLKQAIVLGGQLDPMTVKLLAETEYNIRRSRGQIQGAV